MKRTKPPRAGGRTCALHLGGRALQAALSESVTRHFEMEQDGSFTIDVAAFEAAKAA